MFQVDFSKPCHIYFMGIGGISMSGLAEILLKEGFRVSGSDMKESDITKMLEERGALVKIGQVKENIDYDIDVVYIKEENSGRTVSRHSTEFSHTAMYGKYKYTFVANNQKFIIDVFKTNDYEHYTADIEIKSIDSGINMFEISVGRNGVIEASEEHRFGESECIYISVGP